MEPFIFEHLDEQVDEYPIKIFFSNKGNFACLKVTIKRNMDNTNLYPNNQQSNNTLKVKIRKVLASIIKFAIQSNNHNCSTITHFSYYKTDMHSSIHTWLSDGSHVLMLKETILYSGIHAWILGGVYEDTLLNL